MEGRKERNMVMMNWRSGRKTRRIGTLGMEEREGCGRVGVLEEKEFRQWIINCVWPWKKMPG
jgi:hypothetical protein